MDTLEESQSPVGKERNSRCSNATTPKIRNLFNSQRTRASNRAIAAGRIVMATVLDTIRVDARCRALRGTSHGVAIATVIVDVFQVESMDMTGEVSKNGILVAFLQQVWFLEILSKHELTPRS